MILIKKKTIRNRAKAETLSIKLNESTLVNSHLE